MDTKIIAEPDSEEIREAGAIATDEFITRTLRSINPDTDNTAKIPSAELVAFIKGNEAEQLNKWIGALNFHLRGNAAGSGYRRSESDFNTGILGYGSSTPEYIPPEKGEVIFLHFLQEMKEKITSENVAFWGMKLCFEILNLHKFKDGNGRTARGLFNLFTDGSAFVSGVKGTDRSYLGLLAYYLQKLGTEGILKQEDLDPDANYVSEVSAVAKGAEGNSAMLKFVAARRAGIIQARVDEAKNISSFIDSQKVYGIYEDGTMVYLNDDESELMLHLSPWNKEERSKFAFEYEKVKQQCVQYMQEMLDNQPSWIDYLYASARYNLENQRLASFMAFVDQIRNSPNSVLEANQNPIISQLKMMKKQLSFQKSPLTIEQFALNVQQYINGVGRFIHKDAWVDISADSIINILE